MHYRITLSFSIFLAASLIEYGLCQENVSEALRTRTTSIGEFTFTLPVELRVEKVAGEPLVHWPVVTDWDSQGRLVVVESGGVERPITEHNKRAVHRIVRLADNNGDGKYDSRTVAAKDLPFTEGVLCLGDDMLIAAPPEILKLTDKDGDGFCEGREVWFDGQTITGCANDLHGPYLGVDGWVYWCKGAFAEQAHQLANGKTLRDKAAHIYRRRIEGGPIESVICGGMDNPVEVAFTPEGEKFFTSTFLQHPGNGRRDGIAHAVYGSVFGKDHSAIEGVVRTGPLMPIMTHLGPAAPSGLTCLRTNLNSFGEHSFGEPRGQQRTLVSAQFNLQKVAAHRLEADGATYRTHDTDLLVADRVDFHPTDILEDADGGLLVIDTGGWYDLCCPTSRVDQRVAGGGIYRLTRAEKTNGAQPQAAPSQLDWSSIQLTFCLELLYDIRPWIHRTALVHLAKFGDTAVPPLREILSGNGQPNLERRLRALGALSRIGTDSALQAVANELRKSSQSNSPLSSEAAAFCQAACQIIALHRTREAEDVIRKLTQSPAAPIARAAIEAIGRMGSLAPTSETPGNQSVETLMSVANSRSLDRSLEHSVLFALIELEDTTALAAYLHSPNLIQQRWALVALEEMDNSQLLESHWLLQAAASSDHDLREAALGVLESHGEWAAESELQLRRIWNRHSQSEDELVYRIVRAWRAQPAIQQLVGEWLGELDPKGDAGRIRSLLTCWSNETPPTHWMPKLTTWLTESPEEIAPTLALLDLRGPEYRPLVESILELLAGCTDLELGCSLLSALPGRQTIRNDDLINRLIEDGNYQLLNSIRSTQGQATRMLVELPSLNARQLSFAIETLASAKNRDLDLEVLQGLPTLAAARALPEESLSNFYRHSHPAVQKKAAEVTQLLLRAPADVEATVQTMLAELEGGDPIRGLDVFRGTKANCSACHQMGYVGGSVGPELTRIGRTRTRAALLESLLFPSSRIEQSYGPSKILTHDGQVLNGLVRFEDASTVMLQIAADRTMSIARDEIERMEASDVSIMPTGLQSVLNSRELSDLLALLESAR